jgi:hypothetical protein
MSTFEFFAILAGWWILGNMSHVLFNPYHRKHFWKSLVNHLFGAEFFQLED